MKLKLGQVLKKFKSKKGREVILRIVERNDLNDLLYMINSIIDEDDYILLNKKLTKEREKEWLENAIKNILKGEEIFVCAVINSKIIGSSTINRGRGRQSHVGSTGITIMKNYREEGIGVQLLKETLRVSREKLKLKIAILEVYETNNRAKNLYKKLGFKVYGKLPKGILRKGKYITDIKMYKEL